MYGVKAQELYDKLEKDFKLDRFTDDWDNMDFNEFISDDFEKKFMGVLCDNSEEIGRVYTAVFPSNKVLNHVLEKGAKKSLLFTHHPMVWDITKENVWANPDKKLLEKLKERKISIYTLHVPLDNNGKYSTTVNLSKQLGINIEGEFSKYYGAMVGVFGKTECKNVGEIAKKLELAVGHKVKIYNYGSNEIKGQKIALIAGGGNNKENLGEIHEVGINTFVTGITIHNDYSKKAHETAKKYRINLIGGTHYSTEKFACIKMCEYFEKLGLPCEFVEDDPVMEDM